MIILYPTETLYALGVNALDERELKILFSLKDRDMSQSASWLVRNLEDIERYAELPEKAVKIAKQFLPGSLTLVLKVRDYVSDAVVSVDRTIGFRISSDEKTKKLIGEFMEEHDLPLTCTSANVHDAPTFSTPGEILQQFGEKAQLIGEIIDDGPRKALASTVVRVIVDEVVVLREGAISEEDIMYCVKEKKS